MALFSGVKFLIVLAGIAWTANHLFPIFGKADTSLQAAGECFPLQFPDSHKLELTDSNGKSIELKTLWQFNLKNESANEVKDITVDLPFGGFYKIAQDKAGSTVNNFERNIKIGTIEPYKEIAVTVWTDKDLDPGMEGETRINHTNGTISIDYPVKVRGFMAWLVHSKLLLGVISSVVVLLFMM